jgi:hypothetical protein
MFVYSLVEKNIDFSISVFQTALILPRTGFDHIPKLFEPFSNQNITTMSLCRVF